MGVLPIIRLALLERNHRKAGLLAAAAALLAAAVYLNSLANGFAMDDVGVILENPRVHGTDRLLEAITTPYWPASLPVASPYRPVTTASFALNWALGNGTAAAFHAVNVALHAAVTALVLLLLLRFGAPALGAALGAAVFAVHPVHTEAVANIVGRAELLMALFTLLASLVYLRPGSRPALRVAAVAAAYTFALGSKENAVVLPALLLLLEAFRPGHEQGFLRRVWAQKWLFVTLLLVTAAYAGARYAVLGVFTSRDVAAYILPLPAGARVATALRIWPEYVRLLFFPRDLVADYAPAVILPVSGFDPRVPAGALIAAGSVALGILARRQHPWIALAALWFAITIFPVSNLVVPIAVWLAERNLYLPSFAVSLMAAAATTRVLHTSPRTRWLGATLALLLLASGAWRTWTRNPTWRSTQTVLLTLVREHPESAKAQWVIGETLIAQGRRQEGLEHYRRAFQLAPAGLLALDYARQLLNASRPAHAEAVLLAAPSSTFPLWYLSLARSRQQQGKGLQARATLQAGLRAFPHHPELRAQREMLETRRE